PIAKLNVGERVYGTERRGRYRRYVTTRVLAGGGKTKRAYRVTLEDGTQLVASAHHRFLSHRGWKDGTGSEKGPDQRPFLTERNSLMGVGAFAEPPAEDREYRLGYLTGMIRGDGTLGTYAYPARSGRSAQVVHRFRLALI